MQLTSASLKEAASYDFSASITTGGTAQSLLPVQRTRSYLLIQNISSAVASVEWGPARAAATISSGGVTSVSVTNAGIAYLYPPTVMFYGGFIGSLGYPVPGSADIISQLIPTPAGRVAKAHTVLSGSTVGSIVIDDPGAGYTYPPFVHLVNDVRDPYGVAAPSGTVGYLLPQYGSLVLEATTCVTAQFAIWGGTTGQTITCKLVG